MEPLPATMPQTAGSWIWISPCRLASGWPNSCRSPSSTTSNWPWRSWFNWRSTPRRKTALDRLLALNRLALVTRLELFMALLMVSLLDLRGGKAEGAVGGLVGENRCAFEKQAQGLPVDRQAGLGGHPGKAPQVAVQAGAIKGFAVQAEGCVEDLEIALPVGHVHAESFGGRAEAHAVFQVPGQERRDMERLGHADVLVAVALGGQYVVVVLAPGGVGDFAENRQQLAVEVMAVEETHRVERQAPTAGLGQQADRALRGLPEGFTDLLANGIDQAHALAREAAQVVGFAKREGRQALAAGQGREPEYRVLFVEVQVQQADPVAEPMGPWRKAPVADPAAVQGAVHRDSPKAAQTRRALVTPSSWKPLAQ